MTHKQDARIDAFVQALHTAAAREKKPLVRSTRFTVPPSELDPVQHDILSWKTQEFAYRQFSQDRDELPTLARGLFTERVKSAEGDFERIVVRGYDKFFNREELAWTKSNAIATYTTNPFILSFKENGCIIFISALSSKRLIVTSKHSLGTPSEDGRPSHAEMGWKWVRHHLAQAGRLEEDLAAELWRRNETATFELCDDSFEEHVLAYPPERTGLHLHGLNKNAIEFETRPMEEVNAFAEEWGFIPVRFFTLQTHEEVEAFAKKVSLTGSLDGEPIEGFVVRTQMPSTVEVHPDVVTPPYAPNQTWFYKIKFDEPYLMYRDWRELTRSMLRAKMDWDAAQMLQKTKNVSVVEEMKEGVESQGEATANGTLSKNAIKRARRAMQREKEAADRANGITKPLPPTPKSRRTETLLYIQWCYDRLYGNEATKVAPQPALFAEFHQGHGIIALREAYLNYLASPEGQKALQSYCKDPSTRDLRDDERPFAKTLVVPIAVPGCGKTAMFVALRYLFGWAHTQSDDVQSKRTGPGFLKNVEKLLLSNDVVLADRNNHLLKHRDEFVELVRRVSDPEKGRTGRVRLCAIVWSIDGLAHSDIQSVCSKRIVGRGDRHQCLRNEGGTFQYNTILTRFIKDTHPFRGAQLGEGSAGVSDDQFDDALCLDIHDTMDVSLHRVLAFLCPITNTPMPSNDQINEAINAALCYRPSVVKPLPKPEADKPQHDPLAVLPSSYIAVSVQLKLKDLVHEVLTMVPMCEDVANAHCVLDRITKLNRVIQRSHITIVHRQDIVKGMYELAVWDKLFAFATQSKDAPEVEVELSALLWNERVMAFEVSNLHCGAWSDVGAMSPRKHLHVTVGTADVSATPYESNLLFEPNSKAHCLSFPPLKFKGQLQFCSNPKK